MKKHEHVWHEVWSNFRYGLVTTKRIFRCSSCDELGYSV